MTRPTTIIFIDGSNTYFAQKKMGKWLDWVKVKRFLEGKYQVLEYRYYVGLREKDKGMKSFLKKLKKIGFKIITKPVKVAVNKEGETFEKANFDVEMTADLLLRWDAIEAAVFFSGDSDFAYLCNLIHKRKKKIYFFASKKTLAWELRKKADHFFYLEDFSHLTKHKSFARL